MIELTFKLFWNKITSKINNYKNENVGGKKYKENTVLELLL